MFRQSSGLRAFAFFAGLTLLDHVDWQRLTAELSFWIAVPAWGRGIGGRAVEATLRRAWHELYLSALLANCHIDNVRSRSILAKFGFEETARFIGEGAWGGKFEGHTWLHFRARNNAGNGNTDQR